MGNALKRICIATHELGEVSGANGLGVATGALAVSLARAGHDVTVLFAGAAIVPPADAMERYRTEGVALEFLPHADPESVVAPGPLALSWRVFSWIGEEHHNRPFDVVHIPDAYGIGAVCALASRSGTDLTGATIVVGAHGPMPWIREGLRAPNWTAEEHLEEFLEEEELRCADVVISPSQFLLDYFDKRGIELPPHRAVQQNCLDPGLDQLLARPRILDKPKIGDIAFFGRLVRLKGLELFCDALDGLVGQTDRTDFTVTFIGRNDWVAGVPADQYISRRAARWPWKTQILTELDRHQAIQHMDTHRSVAVVASLVENSPTTVRELMAAGIPFLAANTGGIRELLVEDDHSESLFDISGGSGPVMPPSRSEYGTAAVPADLTNRLTRVLQCPPRPARFAVDPALATRLHVALYSSLPRDSGYQCSGADIPDDTDLFVDGRGVERLGPWEPLLDRFASATVLLEDHGARPGSSDRRWKFAYPDRRRAALWVALESCKAKNVLVSSSGLDPSPSVADGVDEWLRRVAADAALLPCVMTGSDGRHRLSIPDPAVAGSAFLRPWFQPGALLVARSSLEVLGPGVLAGTAAVVRDLLVRMALAGRRLTCVPAIAGIRIETPEETAARQGGILPHELMSPSELTDALVPFAAAMPSALRDIPGQLAAVSRQLRSARVALARETAAREQADEQLRELREQVAASTHQPFVHLGV